MDHKQNILGKIQSGKALIGVIGMGYVGLPIALRFADVGSTALGFDIDPAKVENLNSGNSYIKHIPGATIKAQLDKGLFSATADFSRLTECDAIIIAVPTPLTDKMEPDLSYVEATADEIAMFLRAGQAVSLESTTYPGTVREILLTKFAARGLEVGKDYFLIYSPEREDPGNENFSIQRIPKVVGGVTPDCVEVGKAIYGAIVEQVVQVSSTEVAEITKLFENIFRSVNIALVNELKMLTDRMGIDVWEVIGASSTKPFGFMPFYPGPGLGGHCIPIDPFYLSWKAKEFDFTTRFIELAGEINTGMPYWVVNKIAEVLNTQRKCLNGSKIMVLGVAYKKNVDDMRESPALHLIDLLKKSGVDVVYHDPYIPKLPRTRSFAFEKSSLELTAANVAQCDAIVIVTDHDNVDYGLIRDNAKLVIDTRNMMARQGLEGDSIVKA